MRGNKSAVVQGELSQQGAERAKLVGPLKEALLGLKAAKQAEERLGAENKALREAAAQLRATQVSIKCTCLAGCTAKHDSAGWLQASQAHADRDAQLQHKTR